MTDRDEEALDDEQRAAVEAGEKAIAVLAGPGSGKTRTLSHRARHLLERDPGSSALLLTFTNKAAAEMKTRALAMGNVSAERIDAGTFHAFGAAFLRSHGHHVGIEQDFDILDKEDQEAFAAEVAAAAHLPDYLSGWSRSRLRQEKPRPRVAEFGEAYERAKRAAGLVDFDDLVVYPAQLLTSDEAIATAYGARYAHVLVDEFQDTNPVHFAIVSALSLHVSTVSVFADDDQAIMQFTGADSRNVGRFVDHLQAKHYPLTCNYRCREAIVTAANRLIAAGPKASGRQMRPDKDGGEVEARAYLSKEAEAGAVAEEIAELVLRQGVPAASIAILTRVGYRVDELVAGLGYYGVPVTDWRGPAYESAERRLLVTCMSAARAQVNSRQATRLAELIGVPPSDERDTRRLLEAHAGHPVADELLLLREEAFAGASPHALALRAQRAIAAHDADAGQRVGTLVAAVADFEQFDPNFTLEHLLVDLALRSGGRPPTEGGGVKVASLQGTKGLECATVYLVGMEDDMLPYYRAVQEGTVDEERRICFVGVCRAEDRLVLTCVRTEGRWTKTPSRFLEELGHPLR